MRYRVDEIGFTCPSGLADVTSYSFRSTSPREQLDIEFEAPAGGATPAEHAIADIRQQMVDHLGSALAIVGEGDRSIAGKPGKALHFEFDDHGAPSQGFIVIANLGSDASEGDWVQLSWQFKGSAAALRGLVDPVLASFRAGAATAPAIGSNLRQAGPWVFELPSRYAGPRSFVWTDDEAEQRVSITIHPFDVDKPDVAKAIAKLEARGRSVTARDDVPIIYGQLVRLRLQDAAGEQFFVSRAQQAYQIGNPVRVRWVEVAVEGLLADEAALRKRIDDLLASIKVEDRP